MRIGVVYGEYHSGGAIDYTFEALARLHHQITRLQSGEYFASNPDNFDVYFGQDTGDGVDFRNATPKHLAKTSMWYWDSAWNYIQRNPGDYDMAKLISDKGGWVFFAWTTDADRCTRLKGEIRQSWLPVAGDPNRWPDEPKENKIYEMSIVGNCYDGGRGGILNYAKDNCKLYWPGPNGAFFGEAAKIYRQSYAVFHVPTFYKQPNAQTGERIDLLHGATMRHWEAMCVGVPLVSTWKNDYDKLGFKEGIHTFTWEEPDQIPSALSRAKQASIEGGVEYSKKLRQLVLNGNTYDDRLNQAFDVLRKNGVLKS